MLTMLSTLPPIESIASRALVSFLFLGGELESGEGNFFAFTGFGGESNFRGGGFWEG